MMYIVRFVRKDGKPDEEYFYQKLQDAKYHFKLFEDDDCGIYKRVCIEIYESSTEIESRQVEIKGE